MEKKAEKESSFKYIVRIANVDLDGNKSFVYGLTRLPGIGVRVAEIIADEIGVPRWEKIGNLSDEKIEEMEKVLNNFSDLVPSWLVNRRADLETGADLHIYGAQTLRYKQDDVNRMRKIRCYRGIRHEQGQKVRGQRTRSNGRTGLTVGVTRKAARLAIQKSKKSEG